MESNNIPKADVTSQPVICEVCGSYFETRRGLSSHARQHLRQLGVTVSENSGAPINLLYKIIQERDGSLPASSTPVLTPQKKTELQDHRDNPVPRDNRTTQHKALPQGSFSESKISEGRSSTSSSFQEPTAKPIWAPQDTDAPLTLASTSKDEVHVCQVCGAWYETRKGLSSHARAHLRQIGLSESADSKISPIELLYKVMGSEDVKDVDDMPPEIHTHPKSSTKRPSGLSTLSSSPQSSKPSKRVKASEEFNCVLCGENFGNRKGLASHSRFHLRQYGVADLLGKAPAIETLQELVNSGTLGTTQPHTEGSPASSAEAAAAPPPTVSSPSAAPSKSSSASSPASLSPLTSASRAPKAKKGFWLAVDPLRKKPKMEPGEIEVSYDLIKWFNGGVSSPSQRLPSPVVNSQLVNAGSDANIESIPIIPCEYCGQLFDTRKALSCHVRAHLRQLGITWSTNTSPIDLLQEVMTQGAQVKKDTVASCGSPSGGPSWAHKRLMENVLTGDSAGESYTTPLDFSLKSSPGKAVVASQADTSCELCGFDFDNRKALASHARAHLRQLGVTEWKADGVKGSPIEILSEWIRKEPAKVAEITQRYRMGDLYIKKSHRTAPSPSRSTDSDSVSGSRVKPPGLGPGHRAGKESSGVTGASFKKSEEESQSHSDFGVRSPKGHHLPQHSSMPTEESRPGNIPALLPKPPLTPLVKSVGKVYSLKCRFCEEVFHGPRSIQEDWITHLQKHIVTLGYKGKASLVPAALATSALIDPVV